MRAEAEEWAGAAVGLGGRDGFAFGDDGGVGGGLGCERAGGWEGGELRVGEGKGEGAVAGKLFMVGGIVAVGE